MNNDRFIRWTLNVDPEVAEQFEQRAPTGVSRSWLICYLLRERLGMLPADEKDLVRFKKADEDLK